MTWTPAVLAERLNGDEKLARELVQIFLNEYRDLLDAVRVSVRVGDARAIRRAAHALKGCVGNFVNDGPAQTAREIECTAEGACLDGVVPLLDRLEREVDDLAAAMRRSLENTSCAS